jgi:mannose-6-phosphate isomerase-like protein (cupin superfamily)
MVVAGRSSRFCAYPVRAKGVAARIARRSDVYSPRVNDYDVKAAHAQGEHVWHVHEQTDEFFLVIDGRFNITLRDPDGGERTAELHAGDIFVVPRGTEHKPSSPGGPS